MNKNSINLKLKYTKKEKEILNILIFLFNEHENSETKRQIFITYYLIFISFIIIWILINTIIVLNNI